MVNATTKQSLTDTPKRLGVIGHLCLIGLGLVILMVLQHRYWYGENGHASVQTLHEQVAKQKAINIEQAYINNLLRADVHDLKTQTSAIEEHARIDLGLIKSGETFFQMSNAPITYSHQNFNDEADVVEPIDGLEIENAAP
ncbi:FtsB family cell division protein [Moraxella oculi]|uniref:Cell division protein FtsB n=1 Tax=Moraxella oculi TaxID=2940516 RepID=A0ABW8U720_9GAMM